MCYIIVMKKSLVIIFSILLVINIGLFYYLYGYEENEPAKTETIVKKTSNKTGSSSFSFVGVGDNLIHAAIWYEQNSQGLPFDFTDIYEYTNPYTQNADLAFINGETICAPGYELSHYPVFNGPTEILDAVHSAGFDWMALSSNHSMDMSSDGLIAEINYLKENYPDILWTGSHDTKEDASNYRVKEINGIKVGLLGYTYGLNGYNLPEDKPWLIDLIDKDKIKQDMEEISKISDVQIVSMHWGQEYNTSITEEQEQLANYLNELGVEVIIGHHPHVIEPAEIISTENQDTLVYYSLGNFLSAQDSAEGMVGGMASFTLNYDFDTQKTTFDDVKFIPTITYYDSSYYNFKTMTIHEYNDEFAASHCVTVNGIDISKAWVQNYVQSIMQNPKGIEIVLE